jgi:hypothetical protein
VLVNQNQTLLDIAVLQSGDWTACFALALANNISITKELKSGDEIIPTAIIDGDAVGELKSRNARPASAIQIDADGDFAGNKSGIDFWIIEKDFVVS